MPVVVVVIVVGDVFQLAPEEGDLRFETLLFSRHGLAPTPPAAGRSTQSSNVGIVPNRVANSR